MKISEKCIHCGKCTKVCPFLEKYSIDLSEFEEREDIKYHCFLCRECYYECPLKIDGSKIAMEMRLNETKGKKIKEKGYGLLILEKDHYKFRKWQNPKTVDKKNTLLFPGCNFISLYPETTDLLIKKAEEKGFITASDCCGKPLFEVGLKDKARKNTERLKEEMRKRNVFEIVCVCPNCFYFLKGMGFEKEFKIKMIYEYPDLLFMRTKNTYGERREEIKETYEGKKIYIPCPDRESEEILKSVMKITGRGFKRTEGIICCGAGGGAWNKDEDVTDTPSQRMKELGEVYTYCATCTASFRKKGANVKHILTDIMDTKEVPDVNNSLINRIKRRFSL